MVTSEPAESFRGLLLRYRGRTRLTQRLFASRTGVTVRAVQDWEGGGSYPSAERLEALIRVLLEVAGLTPGNETQEARALWDAAERESPRMHAPFDSAWFARLLAERVAPPASPDAVRTPVSPMLEANAAEPSAVERREDWGEAPDVVNFVGRADELALLRRWIVNEHTRLVALLGMGGIGKTSLAAHLAQAVAPGFERVYWRGLRDAPPVNEWLAGAISFLSDQQLAPSAAESERIAALLQLLRDRRCMLVLDNFETVFEPARHEGRYRVGLDGYGRLLQALGEATHQSCAVLTSREEPPELALLVGRAARTFELSGLGIDDAQVLLAPKQLSGTGPQWADLNDRFGGNGLALKVIGETIRAVFGGDIGAFLEEASGGRVFGSIRRLLAEQIDRSSVLEQHVLRMLAVEREPVPAAGLLSALGPRFSRASVVEAVEALRRRSLVERAETPGPAAFMLQSVVLEYVTERLVDDVVNEIAHGRPAVLVEQPLVKGLARDYVRQAQERLIGLPILEHLKADYDLSGTEQRLIAVLDVLRDQPVEEQGFAPGNVVNLLRLLRGDVRGLDLSHLLIRQAYLAEVDAQDASLVDAHLAETPLAEAFDFPSSIALSGDSALLSAGTSTGHVWLWRVADRRPLWAVQGHMGGVYSVALSLDGHLLVSGGEDGAVQLWETSSSRLMATLQGHPGGVFGVALSPDGHLLASGGADGAVRVWDPSTNLQIATLHGHTGTVWSVALSATGRLLVSAGEDGTVRVWSTPPASPSGWQHLATLRGHTGPVWNLSLSADGQLVASTGADGSVRLWDASAGQPLATLQGETGRARRVALSANGELVASGGGDGTVRLWETNTGRPLACLQGHTSGVWGVKMSTDGHVLVSSGEDGTVRLWETSTRRPLATLQGHTGTIWGVALSADGHLAASGGGDGIVRLWEASTGRLQASLRGHSGGVWSVALSADGELAASGGGDGTVRLWQTRTGRPLATLRGYPSGLWGVALSADGDLVASGGEDGTVRLWETRTGRPLATLQGSTAQVRGVALSADGRLLASSGEDGIVRLWETSTGWALAALQGHVGAVWSVALSADGELVASGGGDGTVRLWETSRGRLVRTLHGHASGGRHVALSADGHLVASGGGDGMVRLWATSSGQPVAVLQGHMGVVWGVALSTDAQLVLSGGFDGMVRLWEASSGTCIRAFRAERRYERLDITGLTGITDAQRAALLALGAVEERAVRN